MDYDDYVKHISQKYKIAVAVAVIKEKPENLTIDQYINDLRNKINFTTESDDLDITLGSEDFNFSDNDEVYDFIDNVLELDTINDDASNRSITLLDNFDVNMREVEDMHNDQNLLNVTNKSPETPYTNHGQNLCSDDSEPLKDLTTNKNCTNSKAWNILRNKRKECDNKLKESLLDQTINVDAVNDKSTQAGDRASTDVQSQNTMDIDLEIKDTADNVKTQHNNGTNVFTYTNNYTREVFETESLQPFKMIDSLATKIFHNITRNPNTTIEDKAIENNEVKEVYVKNKVRKEPTKSTEHKQREEIDITEKVRQYLSKQTQDILDKAEIDKNNSISNTQSLDTQTIGLIDGNLNTTDNSKPNTEEISNQINTNQYPLIQTDSQGTILYTYQGASQNCTHISQSQADNIEIANNLIFGRKDGVSNYEKSKRTDSMYYWDYNVDNFGNNKKVTNMDIQSEFYKGNNYNSLTNNNLKGQGQNEARYYDIENTETFQMDNITERSDNPVLTDANIKPYKDNTNKENSRNASQEVNKVTTRNDIDLNVNQTQIAYVIDKNGNAYKILNGNSQNNNTITLTQETDIQKVFNDISNSQTIEETQVNQIEMENTDSISTDEEISATQNVTVPFKVIEELNKVKIFLNRKVERHSEGQLTDSGYNSDSQSRSSFKSALQNSDGWLNQSAFCLFNYIVECPLNEATTELTLQISQVLAKLIDKLHDIENYPSFLEQILDYIDKLIQNIYTGDNSILTSDEYIQRILLLNKSIHIIKYSIDKLNIQFKDLHQKLTDHSTFELENISNLENVCHLFHLLEILIKRYLTCRKKSNEMATQSQDEKLFKKSSITEIWKKKWNPDHKKVEKSQGLFEKKCVINKCSDLLNKLVVDCMEGYSLVAFAALQCFNLLQSQ